LISERTKAALKAAKAKGVQLGRHGAEVLAPKYRAEANQRAADLAPIMREMEGKGYSFAAWPSSSPDGKSKRLAGERGIRRLSNHKGRLA
jgi:DNA invertase Pin-like site-specific DNA recombinase